MKGTTHHRRRIMGDEEKEHHDNDLTRLRICLMIERKRSER